MNTAVTNAKQFVQDYLNALSGQPKTEKLLDEYISDPGLKEHIRAVEAAFPAYELVPNQLVAEGDVVAVRGTFHGVHKGEFAGIQPTGKSVSGELMIFYRMKEGRLAEYWLQMDMAGLIEQLRK